MSRIDGLAAIARTCAKPALCMSWEVVDCTRLLSGTRRRSAIIRRDHGPIAPALSAGPRRLPTVAGRATGAAGAAADGAADPVGQPTRSVGDASGDCGPLLGR